MIKLCEKKLQVCGPLVRGFSHLPSSVRAEILSGRDTSWKLSGSRIKEAYFNLEKRAIKKRMLSNIQSCHPGWESSSLVDQLQIDLTCVIDFVNVIVLLLCNKTENIINNMCYIFKCKPRSFNFTYSQSSIAICYLVIWVCLTTVYIYSAQE